MKNFFDNLQGLLIALLFIAAPGLLICVVAFVLNLLGVLDTAIALYDLMRLGIVLLIVVGTIATIIRGR
jgi:hypothetical protein